MESILVTINEANFEYDIHSLVKAFFPKGEVKVAVETDKPEETPAFSTLEKEGLALSVEYLRGGTAVRFEDLEGDLGDRIRLCLNGRQQAVIPVCLKDRVETKNRLKRGLYQMLSVRTGQTLPWGTLTGIRPTKIPMAFLEEGRDEGWICSHLKDTYLVSDAKADLSLAIARRERRLLSRIDYEDGYSLYIGIPFCPSTCLYCSFTSYPLGKWAPRMDEYLETLEREMEAVALLCRQKKLNTVYIGGGTPTTLTAGQLDRLLTKVEETFDLSRLLEYTVEAGRPDSITEEKLRVMQMHNVARISINPQTMKQATLDLIGRRHSVEQTVESFRMARGLGFTNINMDLIVGLPEENLEDVRATMEQIQSLAPDSVTVHSLALKRAARLSMEREVYGGLHMENTWDTIELTAQYAQKMGLVPYYLYRQKNMAGNFENVGYAREGCEGLYNILIMEEKQSILALGAGSITKRVFPGGRIERCDNVKDVAQYMERIDEMIERKRLLFRAAHLTEGTASEGK